MLLVHTLKSLRIQKSAEQYLHFFIRKNCNNLQIIFLDKLSQYS